MNIIVADGILYFEQKHRNNFIDAPQADRIARANGHLYVERFVKAYPDGTLLKLGADMKVQHDLYECSDFTPEEQESNNIARFVCEFGLGVCKLCGAGEIELLEPCKGKRN